MVDRKNGRWEWNWSQVISVVVILLAMLGHYFASEASTNEAIGRFDERIIKNGENIATNGKGIETCRMHIRELEQNKADK